MSVEAIQWALMLDHKNATHKVVLIALANHANPDGGECYPSIARLETYTGLHRSNIIKAVKQMEELGIISAIHERGKKTRYTLKLAVKVVAPRDRSRSDTSSAPRPDQSRSATGTSSAPRPKPSLTVHEPSIERGARGARLPSDWILPGEWWSWAAQTGLTGEEIGDEAEKFKDYWIAKAGKDAAKTDWQATWRNWCRRVLADNRRRGPPKNPGRSALMDEILRRANEPAN